MKQFTAYLGSSDNSAGGIHIVHTDAETGAVAFYKKSPSVSAPNYFCISPDKKHLYSGMIDPSFDGDNKGGVCAMKILPDGGLEFQNALPCDAAKGSCHLSCSFDGKYLYAANYSEASVVFYRLCEDGSLAQKLACFQHVAAETQRDPHAHYMLETPDHKYVCAVDLGLDQIILYSLTDGGFARAGEVDCEKGAGPRHMVFSADGRFAYIVYELGCIVQCFAYNDGVFTLLQTLSTLEENNGQSVSSAIRFARDGEFLLIGNRDKNQNGKTLDDPDPDLRSNSVAVFAVDKENGLLTLTDICPTQIPRDLNISPDGRFVYIAAMAKNRVSVFSLSHEGKVQATPYFFDMPSPSCVMFLPV